MRRFKWRLERVLDIKKKQEQKERAGLLALTERLAEKRSELLMRQKMLKDVITDLARTDPKQRLGGQEFFLRHAVTSDKEIERLKDQVSELELRQKEKIAQVHRIRRLKEGLEKLRAEAKRRFVEQQEKLYQKQLDESAAVSFLRRAQS
jgi:flagellar biosynthesis chaperone FliJ